MSNTTTEHHDRSWARRHRALLAALGLVLGTAAGTAIKAMSSAEAKQPHVEIPAADAIGLRQDIGYLRDDIREERHARESLTTQMGEFNGRLRAIEQRQSDTDIGASFSAKRKKKAGE